MDLSNCLLDDISIQYNIVDDILEETSVQNNKKGRIESIYSYSLKEEIPLNFVVFSSYKPLTWIILTLTH